jgi:ADP-dependent NAD(P)H-hydrate dehydratase
MSSPPETVTRAGTRLTERIGIGFLARDLAAELTPTVRDTLTS